MKNEQQAKTESEFIRLREASEWLRVYPSTVLRWVKQGIIPPPHKVGKCVLFDRQAIRNVVMGATVQPDGKATAPEAHGGEAGEALPELPKQSENKPVDGATGTQYREAI